MQTPDKGSGAQRVAMSLNLQSRVFRAPQVQYLNQHGLTPLTVNCVGLPSTGFQSSGCPANLFWRRLNYCRQYYHDNACDTLDSHEGLGSVEQTSFTLPDRRHHLLPRSSKSKVAVVQLTRLVLMELFSFSNMYLPSTAFYVSTEAHIIHCSTIRLTVLLVVILGGSGQHIDTLSDEQLGIFYQLSFAAQFSYALAIGLVKLSITWTLKRIFDVPSVKIASFVIMGCSIAWMLQTIGVAIFLCQPTSLYWNPDVKGNCGNSTVAFTSVSVVDILVDGMILVLPMRPLSKLQVSKAHKIALFTIFGSVVM